MKQPQAKSIFRNIIYVFVVLANLLLACTPLKDWLETGEEPTSPTWFQIAVLPDTQCYVSGKLNGKMEDFEQQIEWIKQNQQSEKIAYVVHLGDVSQNGEKELIEWERARNVMYRLEDPLPGMPDGIPYGVAVGNHDTTPRGKPFQFQNGYMKSFPRSHFLGRSYYGGSIHDREENDCHYDLFEAAGQQFIALYLAFNQPSKAAYDPAYDEEMFTWAGAILQQYSDRKAIIVCHSLLSRPTDSQSDYRADVGDNDPQSKFNSQGKNVYNFAKHYPNVFMMLCGHVSGEGYRIDTFEGNTIKSYLSDYSSRRNAPFEVENSNGGNALMRLMKINTAEETLGVRTVAPRKDGNPIWETDQNSQFTHTLYGPATVPSNPGQLFLYEGWEEHPDGDRKSGYGGGSDIFPSGQWGMSGMYSINSVNILNKTGDWAVMIQNGDNRRLEMKFEIPVSYPSKLSFDYGHATLADATSPLSLSLEYTQDGGTSWLQFGEELQVPASETLEKYSADIELKNPVDQSDLTGAVRFRINKKGDKRLFVDEIKVYEK